MRFSDIHLPAIDTEEPPSRGKSIRVLNEGICSGAVKIPTFSRKYGVANVWQPKDYLPNFNDPERAFEEIRAIQAAARKLPSELVAVLVGDTVTEEGLPLFTSELYALHNLAPAEGVGPESNGLRRFFREWTAEENRHRDVLNAILRMSGRVDPKAHEQTTHLFLEDGNDLGADGDPYKTFYYTSFQELATQCSHKNVAVLTNRYGNRAIRTICGRVAADEGNHADTYENFVDVFLQEDPNEMMEAIADMMERGVVMPAHFMREIKDGKISEPGEVYTRFSNAAQNLGVYTAADYARISGSLLERWGIAERNCDGKWDALPTRCLNEKGEDARARILKRQRVIDRIGAMKRQNTEPEVDFTWLISESGSTRKSEA